MRKSGYPVRGFPMWVGLKKRMYFCTCNRNVAVT